MADINIPAGYGVPLVDLDTDLLPAPTMHALDQRYTVADDAASEQYVDDHITTHVIDPEPHPTYDDMPDLTLLIENGLV